MQGNLIDKYRKLPIQTRSSIAYMIGNIATRSVSIITVPIFTRLLTTSEMGVSTLYSTWYNILYAIVTLSLCSGSLSVAMIDYKDSRDRYESSCLFLSIVSGIICLTMYVLLRKPINHFTGLDTSVFLVLILNLIVYPGVDFWLVRQRFEYKYISSIAVSLSMTVIAAIASIICVCSFQDRVGINLGNVKVISQNLVLASYGVVFCVLVIRKGRILVDSNIWSYALKLSLPLIIHTLAKSILDMSDRLMIASMCGQSDVGIYGTIYNFAMLSLLIWSAINAAIVPMIFEDISKENYNHSDKVIKSLIMFFGISAIIITLLAPEMLKIFTTSEYYEAVYLIPALSAGVFLTAVYNVYGNYLLYRKKSKNVMIATVIAATSNVVLNYFFIRIFGYIAAAYTTFASFVVLAVMQGIMVRIVYKHKVLSDGILFLISLVVCVSCIFCNMLYKFYFIRYCIVGIGIIVLFLKRKFIISMLRR